MKIGLVYTSTTPELIRLVENEVNKVLPEGELISYEDASILAEIRKAGHVTSNAGAKLIELYMKAVREGADAILNICSSVGETADAASAIGVYLNVPIVRIDEEMCRDAVRIAKKKSGRIGVLATLTTTLNPTRNTILREAEKMGCNVQLADGLFDAFGADQETFRNLILAKAGEIVEKSDVILLCQGSMAYCEELVSEHYNIPVVSSPRYGAAALKKALMQKGSFTEQRRKV